MKYKRVFASIVVLSALLVILQACGSSRYMAGEGSTVLYLRNNIHVQAHDNGEYRASYANWTNPGRGHVVVPVNTPVEVNYAAKYLTILIIDTNKAIDFEYDETNMGMTSQQYAGLITSTQPISLAHLSDIDRKGIVDGKAYMGMSKEGVRIALGYPAVHRTPSLNGNTWIYWRNRFGTTAIDFDSGGKVRAIR